MMDLGMVSVGECASATRKQRAGHGNQTGPPAGVLTELSRISKEGESWVTSGDSAPASSMKPAAC
jgi:hypothetical protein